MGLQFNGPLTIDLTTAAVTVTSGTLTLTNAFALDATLAKLTIAQATTQGTNTGALILATALTAAPAYANGNLYPLTMDTAGWMRVLSKDGSIVELGTANTISGTIQIGTTNTISGAVSIATSTSTGLTIYRVLSLATTNGAIVKASPGTVSGWYISNVNAAARFVKLYNLAAALTVGTSTPVITLAIPGNTAGAGANVAFLPGIAFSTGIGIGITGAVADNDTTAVAANEVVVNLFYA